MLKGNCHIKNKDNPLPLGGGASLDEVRGLTRWINSIIDEIVRAAFGMHTGYDVCFCAIICGRCESDGVIDAIAWRKRYYSSRYWDLLRAQYGEQ